MHFTSMLTITVFFILFWFNILGFWLTWYFHVFWFILQCPDYFVVGYGMDFAELYRNLPYVGILKPELYKWSGIFLSWCNCPELIQHMLWYVTYLSWLLQIGLIISERGSKKQYQIWHWSCVFWVRPCSAYHFARSHGAPKDVWWPVVYNVEQAPQAWFEKVGQTLLQVPISPTW